MAQLTVIEGPDAGTSFQLGRLDTIGRDSRCSAAVSDDEVLPRHCKVSRRDGMYQVKDLSALGTLSVNGKACRQGRLRQGDMLKIGSSVLVFTEDEVVDVPELPPDPAQDHIETRVQRRYESSAMPVLAVLEEGRGADDRLARLLRASEMASRHGDLDDLLQSILDLLFDALPAERGTIMIHDRATRKFRVAARRVRDGKSPLARKPLSKGVLFEVFKRRQSILVDNAQADSRFDARRSIAEQEVRSILAVPLAFRDRTLGLVALETVTEEGAFQEADLSFVSAVAHQAAVAVENARLFEEAQDKARLSQELELAGSIQQRVLPATLPGRRDLSVFGVTAPAHGVSGDYYDFFEKGQTLFVAAGDVAGKGINAGLVMMMARSFLRPLVKMHGDPGRIVRDLNRHLVRDLRPGMFMSFLLLRWTSGADNLHYCGAGHEHVLLLPPDEPLQTRPVGGMALGLAGEKHAVFADGIVPFPPGAVLVLYSDGVTEAPGPGESRYGLERLQEAVERHRALDPADLTKSILREVKKFSPMGSQHDDITLVAAKREA